MVSASFPYGSLSPRHLHRCSHERLTLDACTQYIRTQSAPVSQKALFDAKTKQTGKLMIKKHWSTDFRGLFKATWASRSALHFSATGENKKVGLSTTRPIGLVRGGRQRRKDRITRTSSLPIEAPRLPGRNIRRPWNHSLLADAVEDARPANAIENDESLNPSMPSWTKQVPPASSLPPPSSTTPPLIYAPETPSVHSRLSRGIREDFNWYWDTFPPNIAEKTRANHFFTKHSSNARLLTMAHKFRLVPESNVPEVAFVGRSNVGKSSLLNAIMNANVKALLARTSSTPGFTKTMNFYGLGPGNGVVLKRLPERKSRILGPGGLTIVDMPGYGEGSLTSWGEEIMKYIRSRRQLRRVFVLLDAEVGIKDKDRSLLASLRLAGVSHQVVLSKVDKLYIPSARELKRYDGKMLARLRPKGSVDDVGEAMKRMRTEIQPPVGGGALGEMLACSAELRADGKRLGVDHVRFAILKAVGLEREVGSFKGDAFQRVTPCPE